MTITFEKYLSKYKEENYDSEHEFTRKDTLAAVSAWALLLTNRPKAYEDSHFLQVTHVDSHHSAEYSAVKLVHSNNSADLPPNTSIYPITIDVLRRTLIERYKPGRYDIDKIMNKKVDSDALITMLVGDNKKLPKRVHKISEKYQEEIDKKKLIGQIPLWSAGLGAIVVAFGLKGAGAQHDYNLGQEVIGAVKAEGRAIMDTKYNEKVLEELKQRRADALEKKSFWMSFFGISDKKVRLKEKEYHTDIVYDIGDDGKAVKRRVEDTRVVYSTHKVNIRGKNNDQVAVKRVFDKYFEEINQKIKVVVDDKPIYDSHMRQAADIRAAPTRSLAVINSKKGLIVVLMAVGIVTKFVLDRIFIKPIKIERDQEIINIYRADLLSNVVDNHMRPAQQNSD